MFNISGTRMMCPTITNKALPSNAQGFTLHTRCFLIIATVVSVVWSFKCDSVGFNVLVYILRHSVMRQALGFFMAAGTPQEQSGLGLYCPELFRVIEKPSLSELPGILRSRHQLPPADEGRGQVTESPGAQGTENTLEW